MTTHSRLAPSSAARRVACPGSRAMEEMYPREEQNEYALEGDAAHYVAADALKDLAPEFITEDYLFECEITQEMIDGAKLYKETIERLSNECNRQSILFIEEHIDISIIQDGCFGTPDCWFYGNANGGELVIVDYKFGHRFVEVEENWQLLEYAAGIIEAHVVKHYNPLARIKLVIVQPRSYHKEGPVREWTISRFQAEAYFNILRNAEYQASQDNAMTTPSLECINCRARHACPALQEFALSTAEYVYSTSTPNELQPKHLGNELRLLRDAAKLLDARITGLEEEATSLLKRGKRVPGFILEQTTGRKKWNAPIDEIITMGELMGVNVKKPVELITPTQAIKAGLDETVVNTMSEITKGSFKLVEGESDLTEIQNALAAQRA